METIQIPDIPGHKPLTTATGENGKHVTICLGCGCMGKTLTKYPTCEEYRIATRQEEAMRLMYPEYFDENGIRNQVKNRIV